jgi:hypothetical protein
VRAVLFLSAGRNAATLRRDLEFASKTYGDHPAMQKHKVRFNYRFELALPRQA